MRPVEAIKTCLAKSFQFSGRASLSEFWWFYGFWLLGVFAINSIWRIELPYLSAWASESSFSAPALLFMAIFLLPLLSVGWRRFQDANAPGYFFPVLVLIIVSIELQGAGPNLATALAGMALFFQCLRLSSPGPNSFASNPLEAQS